MFQRTLNGADMINATSLNLPPNENAVRINGDFGTAGQVLAKDSNNKLNWSRVDEVEIPDNSIGGAKLKNDITISTTGDITATNITATNLLKTNTTLELPNTTSALQIGGGIGTGSAGQVLVKDDNNLLAWDFVDDIEIPDRSITHTKLVLKTITDAEIADDAIITRTINDEAVTNAKIKAGTIENDRLKNQTIENGKIKDGTITGGKLASNIAISTTGDITGATITAQDHFVQTTDNGAVENTFTGKLTTTADVQGVDIIATDNFTQTGTSANTLAGPITSTSASASSLGGTLTTESYQQTSANQNDLAGALHITKAGAGTAPTQYSDGGFALQVGTDAINSDAYISRNLIVDGLIKGNIDGDVSDDHIQTQSLEVKQLSAGGDTGIDIKDDFDLRLRQSYGNTIRILLDSSTGTIRLYDNTGAEKLNMTGATGNITSSGGDVIIEDGSSNQTILLDASQGEVRAGHGGAGGFSIVGRGGKFDGATVTSGGYTTKSFIENVDFGAFSNWNLPGRTFRKVWMPVKNASNLQVRWTYTAVKTLEADNNWHDASGEDTYGIGRGLLDINNRRIRTTKIKAKITMNLACNYMLGFRLVYKTSSTLPLGATWTPTQEYLILGDDHTDGTSPEYLGRRQYSFEYPLFPTTQGHYYSFRPEFFIKYAPEPPYGQQPAPPASYPANFARVQFWVGSAVGYAIPTEKTNSDMPATFEIIEMPAEQTEYSDTGGTYPSGPETTLVGGYDEYVAGSDDY